MKKKLVLAALLFVSSIVSVSAAPYNYDVRVLVNQVEVESDVKPFIDLKSNRTYVSVRFVVKALDGDVDWNEETETVTLVKRDGKRITLKKGDKFAYVDGVKQTLDAPAKEVDYRIMVPLRFFSEQLDANVDDVTKNQGMTIVSISDPNAPVSKQVEQTNVSKEVSVQDNKTYKPFEIEKGYDKLAPYLFKNNFKIENGEFVFKVPNLDRFNATYMASNGARTKLVKDKNYRYPLGDGGYIQFAYHHQDSEVEAYYVYLSPTNDNLKNEFSNIKDTVIITSSQVTKRTAGTLEDVMRLFQ